MFPYPTQDTQIDIGTVGWEGDDTYYDKGSGDNEGYTLIKVQLFRGRDYTKELNPTIGQGHKILCHISSGIFRIPPKGTRVYVAFPKGMETAPGAGVIFATVEKNPFIQFDDDRVQMNFGSDTHVVIKGKSVSISDMDNQFVSVGTPRSGGDAGIIFQASDGSGGVIKEGLVSWFASTGPGQTLGGLLQIQTDSIDVICVNGSYIRLEAAGGGKIETFALNNFMKGICWIGVAPTLATAAAWGVTPNTVPALVPVGLSKSVYISPV